MNVLVDATYRRQISELWMQYQRGLFPPKQPGEVRIFVEPPMHGPDARNASWRQSGRPSIGFARF
jgi:hypothetical protein